MDVARYALRGNLGAACAGGAVQANGGQPAFGRPHRQMGQPAARAAPFAKPGQPPAAADRVLPEDAPGHNTAADRVCQKVYRIITRR